MDPQLATVRPQHHAGTPAFAGARRRRAPQAGLAALGLFACVVAGCAIAPTPVDEPASPSAGAAPPISSEVSEGPLTLTLLVDHDTYRSSEPIAGTASLSTTEPELRLFGSSGGIIGFRFWEADGDRRMGPAFDMVCKAYVLGEDRPETSKLRKSGSWGPEDPNAPFYEQFMNDPEIHLPPGRWEIGAVAVFTRDACGGEDQLLLTSVQITVVP